MQASRILLIKLVSKNIFCNNAMIQGKPKHLVTIPEKWQTTKKNQYNRDDRKLITTPTSFHHFHPTTITTKATKSSNNSDGNINNGDTDSLKKIKKIKVDFSIALSSF